MLRLKRRKIGTLNMITKSQNKMSNRFLPHHPNPMPTPPLTDEGKAWARFSIGLMDRNIEILKENDALRKTLFWCYIMMFIGWALFFAAMHFWGESLNM
jgi:hypothetical protein